MYSTLLFIHSLFRWLVLGSLLLAIYRAYRGYFTHKAFSKGDNALRHWTATLAHLQLMIGITLYFKSPLAHQFWSKLGEGINPSDSVFFGLYHLLLMIAAVVLITLGSAMAKRKPTDREKYKTQLLWFSVSLLIIFIAIPWPFSPLAIRPLFRTF